jgi:chromosomal replication initiator protein
MYFDEPTISRGLDNLAVKWNKTFERFQPAPIVRDWLNVSSFAQETVEAAQTDTQAPVSPVGLYSIREAVIKVSRVRKNDFLSIQRLKPIVNARQIFYYLCRKHTSHSFPAIGQRAGGKDHSTILHGANKIKLLVEAGDKEVTTLITQIERELGLL